jgi:hypothetical protein
MTIITRAARVISDIPSWSGALFGPLSRDNNFVLLDSEDVPPGV